MKELTIKEKAERYDEAINVAKSKIKNDKNHTLYEEDIINIFPELRESEDERIKKALLKMLHDTPRDIIWDNYGVHKEGAIAWFEKQGKKKPQGSLRPQKQWKPTEEQIKALNYVVNLMASSESPTENDYYYNVFKNLRKQLKQL